MKPFDRIGRIFTGVSLALLFIILALIWSAPPPLMQARAAPLSAPKPVDGWYVCRDRGIGPVPGVPGNRQRLRLCHDSGWEVNTYCTQPGLPVPPLGRRCTRISEDTYRCGASNQRLREYRILQTPADTPTPTATQVINTVTPTRRPFPGGEGNAARLGALVLVEIGVLLLAGFLGIWIVRAMARHD